MIRTVCDLSNHQRRGGEAVTFDDVLEQALEMLRRRGRVSYRALKVQFQLDDDLLALLRDEIVEVHQLARDQEGPPGAFGLKFIV